MQLLTVYKDQKYANNNTQTLINHMAGEWNGNNDGAVTGGHLRAAMEDTWGTATYHTSRGAASADGVYFPDHTGEDKLPGKIPKSPPNIDFFLVQSSKKSKLKGSTFWPRDWTADTLRAVFADSYTTNAADTFVSKSGTSYWYKWQTLGANSAFPVAQIDETVTVKDKS